MNSTDRLCISCLNVHMPAKDVVSWTAMISGYAYGGDHRHAWRTFIDMFHARRCPNEYTVSSVLKACKGMGIVSCGGLVHGLAVKLGLRGLIYVDNGLVDTYTSCCLSMKNACAVFREIQQKNEVSWTTLISGYTHKGRAERALQFYREMILDEEVEGANPFTFSIVIRACASTGSRYYGEQMHTIFINCKWAMVISQ